MLFETCFASISRSECLVTEKDCEVLQKDCGYDGGLQSEQVREWASGGKTENYTTVSG